MATEGYVKFEYFSKGIPPYYNHSSFPELLDDEKITIETPCLEMNYHQYAAMFKKFLMAVGFDEKNVMQAGCSLAFNEGYSEKLMREVAEEYDLIMSEDLPDILKDRLEQEKEFINKQWLEQNKPEMNHWEERYWTLYRRFNKFASFTDRQLDEMCETATRNTYYTEDTSNKDMWDQGMMQVSTNVPDAWNGLIPGSPKARAAGCICPVLDNEEMPDDKKWIDTACPIHGKKI